MIVHLVCTYVRTLSTSTYHTRGAMITPHAALLDVRILEVQHNKTIDILDCLIILNF